ncbi:putative sodium/calcium exchanger membrane region [Lupinus albus]|uniref:Putative sodium/calcium exchanger membrane region n=1 Tax=Lupinus albus TaxID=3870 RepID=A0A6A4R3B7_LUPAL|nr:putative sodium/calcium exchanger membrane region [Lupinus albus]
MKSLKLDSEFFSMATKVSISKHKFYTLFLNILFLLLSFSFMIIHFHSPEPEVVVMNNHYPFNGNSENDCKSFHNLDDYKAKCFYLKSNDPCDSQGYIDYLYIFYCKFGKFPLLGHSFLFLWLLVLFYLLANTTSVYFCSSLENLSKLLRLSPTIAGVTLLSLGNGAPDVFSSLVSFQVVVYVSSNKWKCINYDDDDDDNDDDAEKGCSSSHGSNHDLSVPLFIGMEKGMVDSIENGAEDEEHDLNIKDRCCCLRSSICEMFLYVLEMPLYLPRRLTIPVICEERWSKPYAISSVILAPILLSILWAPHNKNNFSNTNLIIYGIGLLVGTIFGIIAFFTTETSMPPKKFLFPWHAGGFIMSVTWSYISAQELVGLLVSIGYISGISPSILGLTVLAWGNSLGDLMTNLTMSLNGGSEGTQIAISGCYAGPIFNTVVGLGLSLICTTWSKYPQSVMIPRDSYLLETMALLVVGLVWALIVLIRRDMKLDGVLGVGLLVVYSISLSIRLIQTQGSLGS